MATNLKFLMTEREAAEALSVSFRTLQRYRLAGNGPPFVKLGPDAKAVRYPVKELEAWSSRGLLSSTSDATTKKRRAA
jgi:predicted site-specific integrase-resolvase